MKRFFSFLLLMILFPALLHAGEAMKLVYFHDYEPYSWEGEDRRMKGILIDILDEAISRRMKIPLEHRGYPWARAQMMVEEGEADAFVTFPTPVRRRYTAVSEEGLLSHGYAIFVNADNPKLEELKAVRSLEELKGFQHLQYVGNGWAGQNLRGMDIFWVPTLKKVLDLLAGGSKSVFIDTDTVIRFNIEKLGYGGRIIELSSLTDKVSFHLCVGKKSTFRSILPEFDATLRGMREDGTLQRIYDSYW